MTLTPNETLETELQPAAHETAEHTHDHEGHDHSHEHTHEHSHDHTHEPQATLNPELMREVSVEVDADAVSKSFRKAVKKYQKLARIPGFRVGKVPDSVIKIRFAKEVRQDVLEDLVSERFRQAIEERKLIPVSQPQLTNLLLADGQPLHFKAAFEIKPDIDVTGYETIHVSMPDPALTDAEYAAELANVMEKHVNIEPVEEDRPLVDGDWTEIQFHGEMQELAQVVGEDREEPESEPITGDDVLIEVGGPNTLQAFSDALRGSRAGQEMSFEVTYPEDFGERRLAGRTVKYDVTVKAIKRKVYPEKDDDFAAELDHDSWAEFEQDLREKATQRKKTALENQARDRMIAQFIERFQFPVPETFVQAQIDARLDRGLRGLAQQGMKPEDMRRLNFPGLRAGQRDQAVNEVKASLILDKLAEVEGITVTGDELDQELYIASLRAGESLQTLRGRMEEDGSLTRMRDQILREKVSTILLEKLSR